jgi:hypothetical protein
MRIALLGADQESLTLVRWAVEKGGHELVAAYDSDSHSAVIRGIAPAVRLTESWEELLLGTAANAVVMGRGGKEAAARQAIDFIERRADQLRKLVQAAVPMIVVCPACEAIVGFEIEMIRRDTNAVIFPYVPHMYHPGVLRLEEMVRLPGDSPIGDIEQVAFEREQEDRTRPPVLNRLARDMTLLHVLIGTIQTVSASGSAPTIGRDPLGPKPKELPSLSNLSVHLSTAEGVPARWSIGTALAHDQGRITLTGRSGRAVLSMPKQGDWTLEVSSSQPTIKTYPPDDEPQAVWEGFSLAIDGSTDFSEPSAWLDACRDQEAAEAVDRSLARGRTIELFNEEHTEEESFKGIMAMGGCLLLVMALGVLFIAVIVEGLRLPLRSWPLWRLWPFYLLVPIAAFLLLQLLQLAVKRDDGDLRRLMSHGEAGK